MPPDLRCLTCGAPLPAPPGPAGGRRARFCSGACRQRAYRRRVRSRRAGAGCPGRATELTALRRLLGHHRLVTITGPGGIGKSRLAAELGGACWVNASTVEGGSAEPGERVAPDGHGSQARANTAGGAVEPRQSVVPDGSEHLLEAGTIHAPDNLEQPVVRNQSDLRLGASTAGVAPDPEPALAPDASKRQSPADATDTPTHPAQPLAPDGSERLLAPSTIRLPADLGDLLVLDGCEERPDVCAALVARLLREHRNLRIVATSRMALGVEGEQVLPLRGLAPADGARLLVDRVQLLDPFLAVNQGEVAELCRVLEGVPAALELVAPRVRLLGVAGARQGLRTALDLAPGRRSVRADLERDHRRLGEAEREAWQRLSVLPGPFDAELAAVLGAGPDVLERLVAASLLVPEPAADGTTGLRLWAAGRAFAREQLGAAGGTDAAFERLADHLEREIEPHLTAFLVPDGLCRKLVARAEPVHATIGWLTERGDARLATLTCGLARSWLALGRNVAESEQLLRDALPHVEDRPDLKASLLAALCKAAHRTGRYAEQLKLGEEALTIESALDRKARKASILDLLAAGLRASGRRADERYREALTIARELADPAVISLLLNDLAWAALESGDLTTARDVLAEGLPLARAHATPGRLASVLHTAGALALAAHDHATAEARFVEALLVTNPTDGLKVPYFTEGVAIVLTTRGEHERALGLFACADAVRRGLGAVAEPAWRHRVRQATAAATTGLDPRRAHAATRAGARVSLAAAVAHALDASAHFHATGHGQLTPQEHTVAALVTDGLTNQQIARRLGIAPRTVATHLERIRAKLGVRPRSALAAWFTRTTADG
ncbi:LuxR C-terminal-related transcriptional regulator [Amycolatopsis carbonis]|uniref:LuxR C-terminal-related transcriptional regulator n=1 Tax=Amycolatopsis carbonis TaxID=715471 RepID=A0A9Y2I9Y5_9PSEU|nr:LuxR C-terminal-related transcriptional regulator [Amycolatopsis sp. 2-15]WIX75406.1 LuxR C-terminal-related transcriptional regulator [Amycolatopsis sp. 2-15]